jgi:hypothetical protein
MFEPVLRSQLSSQLISLPSTMGVYSHVPTVSNSASIYILHRFRIFAIVLLQQQLPDSCTCFRLLDLLSQSKFASWCRLT